MHTDFSKTNALPSSVADDAHAAKDHASPGPAPAGDIAFHYSLSGLLKLFVLIAVLMAVISSVPWLAIPILPITITCLRTYQVAKHRRLAGKPLSTREGMAISATTLIIMTLCCLSLLVAAVTAYYLGSLGQAMVFGNSFNLMAGGILMAMLSVGGLSYAWFQTIRKNWAFDMQGTHGERQPATPVPPRRQFQFNLATIFELTTLAAILAVLLPRLPGLAGGVAGPFIAAMIYTARFVSERRDRGEAVTAGARYGFFMRVFAISALLLVMFILALGGGWFVIGMIAHRITGDFDTSVLLGGIGGVALTAAFIAAAWYLRMRQLMNQPEASHGVNDEAAD